MITRHCSGLQYLCFRQNLIKDASALSMAAFKHTLEELHLNDNQLSEVPMIQEFTALRKLELSYNHHVCPPCEVYFLNWRQVADDGFNR